jgi:hypothetical protein
VAAAVEIDVYLSHFIELIICGDTGFRSSIISLNSESEICISPFTNICAANGKTVKEKISIKSCFGLIGFIIPAFISFSIWELVC